MELEKLIVKFIWKSPIVKFIWKSPKPKRATVLLKKGKMGDLSYQISGPFIKLQYN